MATTKEYHDHVLEHLQKAGNATTRKMMGEYCVYYQSNEAPGGSEGRKLVGDICDNRLLLKPTETVLRLLPDAEREYPYEGSKTLMVVVEDVENTELMTEVLNGMYKELPEPKKRR